MSKVTNLPFEVSRFLKYVGQAMEYFGIPQKWANLLITDEFTGGGVDVCNSDEEKIIIAVNPEQLLDPHKSQRIAWHEVGHWKDLIEGLPLFEYKRPKYPKLNFVPIDKKFQEKIYHDLYLKEITKLDITKLELILMFLDMQRTIADAILVRRFNELPAQIKTNIVIGLIKETSKIPPIEDFSLARVYLRLQIIALEMEHLSFTGIPKKFTKKLKEIDERWLKIIFAKYPELKPFFTSSCSLVQEIKFTTSPEKLYDWIIRWIKLIPPKVYSDMAPLYFEH
jgi:hypothetical protein